MLAIILILLGVGCEVVKANAWFVIPDIVSYILFGLGGVMILVSVVNYFSAKNRVNKMSKKFDRW